MHQISYYHFKSGDIFVNLVVYQMEWLNEFSFVLFYLFWFKAKQEKRQGLIVTESISLEKDS